MPRDFTAYTTFTPEPGAASRTETIKVNHPLETGGPTVFLLGNGYAPKITVRDADGTVVYSDATPFLAQDNNYKSVGAVKVPGAQPKQLGFAGLFLPTGVITDNGPTSVFPDALDPALALTVYEGTLFPDSRPQSVYTLDTSGMTQLTNAAGTDALRLWLRPGETAQLPGGRGSITFDGVERFAGLSIRYDPGKGLTLVSALLALAGLIASLVVRRRRVFVRVSTGPETPSDEGRTVVTVGGLAKDDDEGMADVGVGHPHRGEGSLSLMNETLAQYADLAVYSAMGVLTLAMIGYAAYLAWVAPARADARARVPERAPELVAAGAPGAAVTDPVEAAGAAAGPAPDGDDGHDGGGAAYEEPVRARKAAAIARSLAVLGTVFLLAGSVLRGASVQRWPLGNMYEFSVMGSLFTMVVYLAWATRRDLRWLGVFVVTPVLLTLGLGTTVWYTEAAQLMPSLRSYWLVIHVTVATVSVALFSVGFALTGLYLLKSRFGEGRLGRYLDRLPEPRALERLSYGIHVVAFPLWTFTVIAGAIWARQAWGAYWNWDPKEVWSFVIWVVYAAYLHARATAGWRRQAAAWIAIAGFACIIMNYAIVNMYFVGQHSYSGL